MEYPNGEDMAVRNDPSVVSFDAERAAEAAHAVAGRDLSLVVEYDRTAFEVLFRAGAFAARFEDEEALRAQLARAHSYAHLDFTGGELFEDLSADAGEVRALATYLDDYVGVRALVDEEGLFLALAPDASVTAVLEAVEDAVRS